MSHLLRTQVTVVALLVSSSAYGGGSLFDRAFKGFKKVIKDGGVAIAEQF